MLDITNKQHKTPKQGALEVLTTSRAYKCQGFPTPPFTNQKTRLHLKITLVPNKKILPILPIP